MTQLINEVKVLPRAVRVAAALAILERLKNSADVSIQGTLGRLTELGWQWLTSHREIVSAIYDVFGTLIEDSLALSGVDAEQGLLASYFANCLIWEVYDSAFQRSEVQLGQLPAEYCEGDITVWDDAIMQYDLSESCRQLSINELLRQVVETYADFRDQSVSVLSRESFYQAIRDNSAL